MRVHTCDVLVIGSGAAGLRTAIELADSGRDVLVLGKCKRRDAHTKMAQGGINAALKTMDPADSWTLHAADTLRDGGELNHPRAVELLCKHAPQAVYELAAWGCPFAKSAQGEILQRFFGAASYRRACFVGAHTGLAILNTLVDQALKRAISFRSEVYVFALLTHGEQVNGALGIDLARGTLVAFHAKAVVLATGGHSRVYRRSSSRPGENTGDGIALAARVGARFADMEMFQFHPTGMLWPEGAEGLLVTEAVRGEGGILTNAKGERFMQRYDPERMELSARDIVARANYLEGRSSRGTKHGGVYLDVSHIPAKHIYSRLPDMVRQLKVHNKIDITKQKIEVGPTAHYSMGGIVIDHATGSTGVQGLFAVGEVGAGVHGANRLGGNSLAEVMVFGRLVGEHLDRWLKKAKLLSLHDEQIAKHTADLEALRLCRTGRDPKTLKHELGTIMWEKVGVVRDGAKMREALICLKRLRSARIRVGGTLKRNVHLIAALDLQAMLPTCEMIVHSALKRTESRGAHYRNDFPKSSAKWRKTIVCVVRSGSLSLITQLVPPIPKQIAQHLMHERTEHHLE